MPADAFARVSHSHGIATARASTDTCPTDGEDPVITGPVTAWFPDYFV